MIELTIDGKTVQVEDGSMIIQATGKLGIYVPHFCYHKKLSIAASCRMCLVEVEKAPKPVPACATPVTNGMVVHTKSPKARAAQEAVMEFLLINHPLDCPICDQGGECQLQDLAVGYGKSTSEYHEEKRIVMHKNLGPLVSAEEMSRCIHCTRCVRFGQEIAGQMELGMVGRNESSQITNFLGKAIESELSGNMIDVCPVGALTSKPFRYSARTWELARRETISPHDSVGANIIAQVKADVIKRVLPQENEAVNECWISDKDRWSYEGLVTDDRLTKPMVKDENNVWREVEWEDALMYVADALSQISQKDGASAIGALASDYSTLEELSLLKNIFSHLGSKNIDVNLRANDVSLANATEGAPWLGMPIEQLSNLDNVVVIGSNLRKDHPLFAQRLRQAARHSSSINLIDSYGEDPKLKVDSHITVKPSEIALTLRKVSDAISLLKSGKELDLNDDIQSLAAHLHASENAAVLIGNAVTSAPNATEILIAAQILANSFNAKLGFLTSGANTVGAYIVSAVAKSGGLSAKEMINKPLSAYVVMHAEPRYDMEDGVRAEEVLSKAFSVAMTSYKSAGKSWARVMLPIAPFAETSGTFINAEGRAQSFKGVVPSPGQSRPAWKVLRVLANILEVPNCSYESSEEIRDEILSKNIMQLLNNKIIASGSITTVSGYDAAHKSEEFVYERIAEVPIYKTDAIVRRAESLQKMKISTEPVVQLNKNALDKLKVSCGDVINVKSSVGESQFKVICNDKLADDTIRISQGFDNTLVLGNSFAKLSVERV